VLGERGRPTLHRSVSDAESRAVPRARHDRPVERHDRLLQDRPPLWLVTPWGSAVLKIAGYSLIALGIIVMAGPLTPPEWWRL
jgi:hypothetical protein